eukprot:TRINITY_DN262_c0_g1_i2.p1 TRINITY_DN262_c0_g1~~TRINITY_DN262_c0_g1_i2.p1  ORF type:complete len:270 (-),score=56.47 TRINITY_DN262_c0_g1_i2:162-971(-)
MSSTVSVKRERDELDEVTILENPEKRMWLVKIPKFVSAEFCKQPEGFKLGEVIVDPDTKEMKLRLTLESEDPNLPTNYQLKSGQLPMTMKIFQDESSNITFRGTVDAKMDMELNNVDNTRYQALTKNRSIEKNKKTRQTVSMESGSDASLMMKSNVLSIAANKKYIDYGKKDKVLDKAYRMDRDLLLDKLFEAFSTKAHWDSKGLLSYTKQPEAYLKETLAEIAIYNKRGPFKGTYEIKPELSEKRKQEKSDGAPSSSTSVTTTTPTSR